MPTSPPSHRIKDLCNMYFHGSGDSFDILKADFAGSWPPYGLDISPPASAPVTFQTENRIFSDTSAHVSNMERDAIIHINRPAHIGALFHIATRHLANTISHENIHLLQKSLLQQGISDPQGRFRRHKVHQIIKKPLNKNAAYYCDEDELQVRLHMLVSNYYREYRKIPLSKYELLAFLYFQGVKIPQGIIDDTKETPEGAKAIQKFFRAPIPYFRKSGATDINIAIHSINPDKRSEFCAEKLPALYGALLEIYGDHQGSIRMGYECNIISTDLFFRHVWRLDHKASNGIPFDTQKLEDFLKDLKKPQLDYLSAIVEAGGFDHPLSGRNLSISPLAASIVTPLLKMYQAFENNGEIDNRRQKQHFHIN